MKRVLSATVAVATTIALAAPANAATLSRPAQGGVCQVALTPQEKATAVQAEASAKTLTLGMQDGVFLEAYEAAIPGLKKLGDAYVSNQNVKVFLRDQRADRPSDPAVVAAKNAAWDAQRIRITALGMDADDAGNYLTKKQFSLIPERQYSTGLVSGADAFGELLSRGNPGAVDPTYSPGSAGEELARETKLGGAQRDAFVAAVDRTYYGQTMNALVSAYNPAFKATVGCAPANLAFPTAITLPAPQVAKDADLDAIAQDPSLSKTGNPADAGSAFGGSPVAAIIAVVIGLIAMGIGTLAQTYPNLFLQLNLPF